VIFYVKSKFNSIYSSKPLPLCATVSLGWPRPTWDLSALWSPLCPQGPPFVLLFVAFWLSYACARLPPNSGAFHMLAPWLRMVLHLELLAYSSPQFRRCLKAFLFAYSITDTSWDCYWLEWRYTSTSFHYITLWEAIVSTVAFRASSF